MNQRPIKPRININRPSKIHRPNIFILSTHRNIVITIMIQITQSSNSHPKNPILIHTFPVMNQSTIGTTKNISSTHIMQSPNILNI